MDKFLIIDLEATCEENNKYFKNEIIEIGAVLVEDKKIIGEFQSFVKPTENPILTLFCKNLTSITQEQVDQAKTLPYVLGNLKAWLSENYKIICSDCYEPFMFCSWETNS